MDEASIEVLKKSIVDDIYTVTMTPNLSDEKFAGNSSGVALNLKLIPFIRTSTIKRISCQLVWMKGSRYTPQYFTH
ncbi:phage portal protein [Erysipelothrix sp. D19-032]